MKLNKTLLCTILLIASLAISVVSIILVCIFGTNVKKISNGKSAYEIYRDTVDEGNIPMTEDEWLASLIGKNGVGIKDVYLNEDGLLVFVFTDDSESEGIKFPCLGIQPEQDCEHEWGSYQLAPPTCVKEGANLVYCEKCNEFYIEKISVDKIPIILFLKFLNRPVPKWDIPFIRVLIADMKKKQSTKKHFRIILTAML